MTRPRKATVDYFPHDVNHGKTLYILESQFGNDGYAVWFKLLERLGASDGHYVDLRDNASMLHLAAYCRVSVEALTDILRLLSDLGAIDRDLWRGNVVFSGGLVQRVTDAYRKRINNLPTKESITKALKMVYPAETEVSASETIVYDVRNPQREREREREINTTTTTTDTLTDLDESSSKMSINEFRFLFQRSTGNIMPGGCNNQASELCRVYPLDKLKSAFEITAIQGGKTMKYVAAVLKGEPKPEAKQVKSKAEQRIDRNINNAQEAVRIRREAKCAAQPGQGRNHSGSTGTAGGGAGRGHADIEDYRIPGSA